MNVPQSDAFVFFGATGDLAFKKIFPSMQAMIKRGHLDVPVIAMAGFAKNIDELRARAHSSLEKNGKFDAAAFEKLCGLMRFVGGGLYCPGDFPVLTQGAQRRPAAHGLCGYPAVDIPGGRGSAGQRRLQQRRARHS